MFENSQWPLEINIFFDIFDTKIYIHEKENLK